MLLQGIMRATVMFTAAAAAVAILSVARAASAGGYVGLAVGGPASIDGDYAVSAREGEGKNGRLILGQRFGMVSLEAAAGGYAFGNANAGYDVRSIAAGAKVNLPLSGRLEVLLRGGLERTWLSSDDARLADADADGWYGGIGLELPIDLGLGTGSLFVDVSRHEADTNAGTPAHLTATLWGVGVTVGF
ncbi:MAG: hypothetical protein R2939_13210 [Kofleriaceae bacterium]